MQITQGKFLFLLIFAIILCIYPLYATAEIRTFTHFEEKDDYLPKAPRMQRIKIYDDGTTVARIVRLKALEPPKVCFFEVFSLRIIHLNGTVDEKDIELDIPQINHCFLIQDNLPIRFLDYYLIRKNQILITYVNTTNPNDHTSYEDWGMIIDFDGKEYDRTFFGQRFINTTTLQFMPYSDRTILNVNREKGFFRIYSVRGTLRQEWQQYKIETDGTFTKLTSGEVPLYLSSLVGTLKNSYSTSLATVDEGYAILFGNTINNFTATNPLLPQAQFSVLLIGYNQTISSLLSLYQNSLPNLDFTGLNCGISFAGVGQTCVLTVSQIDPAGLAPNQNFFVKIDFLSSGSVTDFTVINNIAPTNDLFKEWGVNSLQFGGFLLTNIVRAPGKVNQDIYGYLYSGDNETPMNWDFDEPVPGNTEGIFEVLPNNTLLVPQFEEGNSWQILAIDLPKFAGDRDKGYNNLNVEATSPAINAFVYPNIPFKISISFYNPVKISNGKLSIYQVAGDQEYKLRQSIPSIKCSIENDGKTISADVLKSTFSVSNGNYFIVMDNEFVKETVFNEPLLGIGKNVWKFMTKEKKDIFAPSTNGLLRFTSNGTKAFDNLSQKEQFNFMITLLEELSAAVPVDRERLTILKTTIQLDTSVKENQYLISIGILETRDENDNNVASIIKIIDTMVKNKDQSPIGFGRVTDYLDESYGFKQFPNLWEAYRTRLIGLIIILVFLIILFFVAKRRYSEGSNMAILQLGVIIFDLVMDILFVSTSARNIPVLYIPSVVFVTLPIAINTSLSFYIISKENENKKFNQWFVKNGNVASTFTVLAGADIEALNILQSNLAGFEFFGAPFSESARTKIFWGSFLNIFTEDIPQIVIQIYYRMNSVTYDIIPLLTLISSSINLMANIVGRIYQAISYLRNSSVSNYNPNDDDSATVISVPDDKSDIEED